MPTGTVEHQANCSGEETLLLALTSDKRQEQVNHVSGADDSRLRFAVQPSQRILRNPGLLALALQQKRAAKQHGDPRIAGLGNTEDGDERSRSLIPVGILCHNNVFLSSERQRGLTIETSAERPGDLVKVDQHRHGSSRCGSAA